MCVKLPDDYLSIHAPEEKVLSPTVTVAPAPQPDVIEIPAAATAPLEPFPNIPPIPPVTQTTAAGQSENDPTVHPAVIPLCAKRQRRESKRLKRHKRRKKKPKIAHIKRLKIKPLPPRPGGNVEEKLNAL